MQQGLQISTQVLEPMKNWIQIRQRHPYSGQQLWYIAYQKYSLQIQGQWHISKDFIFFFHSCQILRLKFWSFYLDCGSGSEYLKSNPSCNIYWLRVYLKKKIRVVFFLSAPAPLFKVGFKLGPSFLRSIWIQFLANETCIWILRGTNPGQLHPGPQLCFFGQNVIFLLSE